MAGLPWDIDKVASKVDLENVENRLNSRADRRLVYLLVSIIGTILAMAAVLLTAIQGLRYAPTVRRMPKACVSRRRATWLVSESTRSA
jgi:hypothetical protein